MSKISIKDIYAGMPDAKDEISTNQIDSFLSSFDVPRNCQSTVCWMDESTLFQVIKVLGKLQFFTIYKMKSRGVMLLHVLRLSTLKATTRKCAKAI